MAASLHIWQVKPNFSRYLPRRSESLVVLRTSLLSEGLAAADDAEHSAAGIGILVHYEEWAIHGIRLAERYGYMSGEMMLGGSDLQIDIDHAFRNIFRGDDGGDKSAGAVVYITDHKTFLIGRISFRQQPFTAENGGG